MSQSRPVKRFDLRLPEALHVQLQSRARAHRQSLNSHILTLLEAAVRDEDLISKPGRSSQYGRS